MSFYKPAAGTSGDIGAFFHDTLVDTSPANIADACPIVPGNPEGGTVDCAVPTEFQSFYELEFDTVAADAIAAQLAADSTTPDYLAYGVYITASGPGYATYGCRRADVPEDSLTLNGCAVLDTRPGISVASRLDVTGDWYPTVASNQSVTGWVDGTTGPYPYQEDSDYALTFGIGTGGIGNEVFVLNPSPVNPSPDAYGNNFWQVLFPAGTIPAPVTITSTMTGVHGVTLDIYVTAYAFKDDGPPDPPPVTDTWMCVL